MRKLFSMLGLGVLCATLAACGGAPAEKFDNTKLADPDEDIYGWCVHGNNLLADDTPNGWNGKSNELYNKSMMTAASLQDVSKVSVKLARTLKGKNLKALYMYDGLQLGVSDAGWKSTFKADDGKLYKANGSYCFKATKLTHIPAEDDAPEVFAEAQWIPHDHDGWSEDLTGNIWTGPWQEAPDDDGFSWDYNPTLKDGKAGKYTLVVAQYNAEQGKPVYGLGLVLKAEDKEKAIAYEEVQPVSEHVYGVIGVNGWGDNDDIMMTKGTDGKYTADVTIATTGTNAKVRMDHAWDTNYGAAAVDQANSTMSALDLTTSGDGNIIFTATGVFTFTLDLTADHQLTIVQKAA